MLEFASGIINNPKEIRDVGVKDDMVYAGYDKGFFLIGDQDG